jgi:hypothetical protein
MNMELMIHTQASIASPIIPLDFPLSCGLKDNTAASQQATLKSISTEIRVTERPKMVNRGRASFITVARRVNRHQCGRDGVCLFSSQVGHILLNEYLCTVHTSYMDDYSNID